MHNMGRIGRAIRYHREAAGLTREGLSDLAGVGTTAIYDVEHGKETVRLRTLIRLFGTLNIDLQLSSPLMEQFNQRDGTAAKHAQTSDEGS